MRGVKIARALVALLCVALLLLCIATSPSAADLQLAIPVLVFCFLVVLALSRLRVSGGECAAQPVSFLSIHISRAPPTA